MAEAKNIQREKMMVALSSVVAAIGLTSMKLRGLLVVLVTCGICPSDKAFENTLPCLSHLADSPGVG